MDTSTPLYGFLQCLGAIPIFVIVYVAWSWFTSEGNGANVPPEYDDHIIRSDVPGHPENCVFRAGDKTHQRVTGGEKYYKGMDRPYKFYADYVPEDKSGHHATNRYIEYVLHGTRGERNDVEFMRVTVEEQDRISAATGYGSSVWHNTAETDSAPAITETHSGGNGLALVMAVIIVAVIGGGGIVAWFVVLTR